MSDDREILFGVARTVSAMEAKFDSFTDEYKRGRQAQIEKAKEDVGSFQKVHETLSDIMKWKVDRREIGPLMTVNFLCQNWRSVVIILILLSLLGLVTVRGDIWGFLK